MKRETLILVALYGGGFIFGRLYSTALKGTPSSFIYTRLTIESVLTVVSIILLI
jgi:hypothetical protein